jgi:diguanylate cyclase (GGDEF)-like protein
VKFPRSRGRPATILAHEPTRFAPTLLDRARVREMAKRLDRAKPFMAGACIAAAIATLLTSGHNRLWAILPVALFPLTDPWFKRAIHSSPRPEYADAAQGALMTTSIGLAAGLTGGPSSPLAWLLLMGTVVGACRTTTLATGLINALSLAVFAATSLAAASAVSCASLARLLAFIIVVIAAVMVGRALVGAETAARRASVLDPLTGLLNRASFEDRFQELRQQALHAKSSVCLILFDLDNFKAVNDHHGHDVGDDVLRETASRARDGLRRFDLLYRLGGDEFALLLPGVERADGVRHAERLRRLLSDSPVNGLPVTASFGVSAASGSALELASLYRAGDQALYAAKQGGRNHTELAAPRPSTRPESHRIDAEPSPTTHPCDDCGADPSKDPSQPSTDDR